MTLLNLLKRASAMTAVVLTLGSAECAAQSSSPSLPPDMHFRSIKVDVEPLANNIGGPTPDWVARDLPGALQAKFASRLAPGDRAAPTLVVRIDHLFLGESANGIFSPMGQVEARDSIQGAGVVVGPQGQTLGTYPLFTTLDNYTGGSNFEVGTERRRVDDLAKAFAYWLPGQMGL
jgi:hypothetical protein